MGADSNQCAQIALNREHETPAKADTGFPDARAMELPDPESLVAMNIAD
ncbi:MAG: hypothetical protein HY699_18945 [Deltaproteobacteria bacterium]|nr:hypothetical protein [Deltaproteobacteria bacterium]